MINRWTILIVLFLARTTMGFQFQSAGALSPLLMDSYMVSLVEVGVLIGLYLAPGVVVAIPGGAITARFGEKRVVALAMGLMLIGALMALAGPDWGWITAGRLIAGVGGVVLNVVMTKMLADWFVGREISTAMAVFINSWPIGIALALLVLPPVATAMGLAAAQMTVAGVVALGLVLFVLVYRAAPGADAAPQLRVGRLPVVPLGLAALIWGLYNVSLAMVFSFAPTVLAARGLEVTEAAWLTSLFMVVFSLAVPLGGIIADRSGRRDAVIALSLVAFVVALPLVAVVPTGALAALFVAMGLLTPLGAGPVMSLPALVLPNALRAFGMGVFFAIYYAVMMVAPPIAGGLAELYGAESMTMVFGAAVSALALGALVMFRQWRSRPEGPHAAGV